MAYSRNNPRPVRNLHQQKVQESYKLYVGDDFIEVSQGDLYCFEASLYKHWTEPFKNKRIILSYGFILPYSELGRTENDPRVRLSKRIEKYFQKSTNHQI